MFFLIYDGQVSNATRRPHALGVQRVITRLFMQRDVVLASLNWDWQFSLVIIIINRRRRRIVHSCITMGLAVIRGQHWVPHAKWIVARHHLGISWIHISRTVKWWGKSRVKWGSHIRVHRHRRGLTCMINGFRKRRVNFITPGKRFVYFLQFLLFQRAMVGMTVCGSCGGGGGDGVSIIFINRLSKKKNLELKNSII